MILQDQLPDQVGHWELGTTLTAVYVPGLICSLGIDRISI